MSWSDLQDRDQDVTDRGSATLNVDPGSIFKKKFFMSEHNLWQNADVYVTLLSQTYG